MDWGWCVRNLHRCKNTPQLNRVLYYSHLRSIYNTYILMCQHCVMYVVFLHISHPGATIWCCWKNIGSFFRSGAVAISHNSVLTVNNCGRAQYQHQQPQTNADARTFSALKYHCFQTKHFCTYSSLEQSTLTTIIHNDPHFNHQMCQFCHMFIRIL